MTIVVVVCKSIDRRGGKSNLELNLDNESSKPARLALDPEQRNALKQLEQMHKQGRIELRRLAQHSDGTIQAHFHTPQGGLHSIPLVPQFGLSQESSPVGKLRGIKTLRRYTAHTFSLKRPRVSTPKTRTRVSMTGTGDLFDESLHPRAPVGSSAGGQFVSKPKGEDAKPESPSVGGMHLSELLRWSTPKRIQTKLGERNLRTALPNERFWTLWRSHKNALKAAGVSCGKDPNGNWEAQWWSP